MPGWGRAALEFSSQVKLDASANRKRGYLGCTDVYMIAQNTSHDHMS